MRGNLILHELADHYTETIIFQWPLSGAADWLLLKGSGRDGGVIRRQI